MKLEPLVLEWQKVVAALLHGSLLQLLTNSLGEDESMHRKANFLDMSVSRSCLHFADLGSCSQQ